MFAIIFLMFVSNVSLVDSMFLDSARSSIFGERSNLMHSVVSGTQMAIEHCQHLFQWERWNCPKTIFTRQSRLVSTKETAFAKAILAAGIAHSITRNCSLGYIEGCSCQKSNKIPYYPPLEFVGNSEELKLGNFTHSNLRNDSMNHPNGPNQNKSNENVQWKWGGCSDNPKFAVDATTSIVKSMETGMDVSAYIARHNSRVGIKLIQKSMVKKCRCHGVSGSCSIQTCWMQASPFEEISRKLKDLHRKSVRVTYDTVEKAIVMGNSASHNYVEEKEIPGTENRLIYLDNSPDYCITNYTEGHMGTKGRTCSKNRLNATKIEKNSCRNLCRKCGHSVKRLQKKVTRRCNCTFTWCCEVKCETCIEEVNEYFCI